MPAPALPNHRRDRLRATSGSGTRPSSWIGTKTSRPQRFGLKSLADRDRDADDMLDRFDFHQKPVAIGVITKQTKLKFSDMKTMP